MGVVDGVSFERGDYRDRLRKPEESFHSDPIGGARGDPERREDIRKGRSRYKQTGFLDQGVTGNPGEFRT